MSFAPPPSSASLSCVVGTLPPPLMAAISQPSHNVVAYLSTELPSTDAACETAPAKDSDVSSSTTAHDDRALLRYAVFEDTSALRRWTVQLRCCDRSASGEAEAWRVSQETLEDLQLPNQAVSSTEPADASRLVPLPGAKYAMLHETWTESTTVRASSSPATSSTLRGVAAPSDAPSTAPAEQQTKTDGTGASERAFSKAAVDHPSPASLEVPTPDAAEKTATTAALPTLATGTHSAVKNPPGPAPTAGSPPAASQLKGLSLQELSKQHSALVRLLVQLLALRRMTVSQVLREVCTASGGSSHMICSVHDTAASSSSEMRYTEADVAAAVEQLTLPHTLHPRQRELKSEAYFLMRLDGFEDGALQRQAADRAYPALAQHWPASAALLDAMERYVNRQVVLETRKRHPELTATPAGGGRRSKRQRSSSSSVSPATSEEDDGEARPPHTSAPAKPLDGTSEGTLSSASQPQAPRQHTPQPPSRQAFRSLREYPQSLERGDLHRWCGGAEAAQVRECLHAATTLAQQPSTSRSGRAAKTVDSASSPALSTLPIATVEDVAVLRGHYDALAAAEATMERQLLDYRDTTQALRAWYRPEACAPQFQAELCAWLQTQEESRTVLVCLYKTVHEIRYRLERDLNDYLHLHALRVL